MRKESEMSRSFFGFFLLLCPICIAADSNPASHSLEHSIIVECHGKLRCNNVSLDGETTGTTVMFDRVVWELNLPDETSKKFAKEHHKEPVTIKGKLRRVTGVSRPVRWVVDVIHIQEQQAGSRSNSATTTICGKLQKQDGSLMISCNDITWPVDVTQNAALKAKADSLTTKTVVIKGNVERIEGKDFPARVKIEAQMIEPVPMTANSKR